VRTLYSSSLWQYEKHEYDAGGTEIRPDSTETVCCRPDAAAASPVLVPAPFRAPLRAPFPAPFGSAAPLRPPAAFQAAFTARSAISAVIRGGYRPLVSLPAPRRNTQTASTALLRKVPAATVAASQEPQNTAEEVPGSLTSRSESDRVDDSACKGLRAPLPAHMPTERSHTGACTEAAIGRGQKRKADAN
jgi:hypothetical protein